MSQGEKRVLFDAAKDGQNIAPKWVAPEDEQEPNESRRCAVRPPHLCLCLVGETDSPLLRCGGGTDCGHG